MTYSDSFYENVERLADERDLFEHIVETDGPLKPEAETILEMIDAWERGEL